LIHFYKRYTQYRQYIATQYTYTHHEIL